jgi:XTP/dITP diphosphohydrolase
MPYLRALFLKAMETLVFATNNEHKLTEVRSLLKDKYIIKGLSDIGCEENIPETSDTLEGNAKLKAKFVSDNYGLSCFSDDTGLEVKSLNMEPGVYSARYAGPQRNSNDNITKLLKELSIRNNRLAQFRTAVCLIINGEEHNFEGKVEGVILTKRTGEGGFGYDSIFKPDEAEISFAQMTSEQKNKISHRGRAIQKLVTFLENND